jgi:hypothetical protein
MYLQHVRNKTIITINITKNFKTPGTYTAVLRLRACRLWVQFRRHLLHAMLANKDRLRVWADSRPTTNTRQESVDGFVDSSVFVRTTSGAHVVMMILLLEWGVDGEAGLDVGWGYRGG